MNKRSSALLWFVAGLLAIMILLQGCYHFPRLHRTGSGVRVHLNADVTVERAVVDSWVDLRLEEWVAHKADWGCGEFTDEELTRAAQLEPVIIHGGWTFPGSGGVAGWNHYDGGKESRITVTLNFPSMRGRGQWDPTYQGDFEWSYGLSQLPHEWTHTVRGNWHP